MGERDGKNPYLRVIEYAGQCPHAECPFRYIKCGECDVRETEEKSENRA